MKKTLKVLIVVLVLLIIGGICFAAFRKITPVDDTKKLYVTCNGNSASFDLYSSAKLTFAEKDEDCKLNIDVRNVERSFLKIVTNRNFYSLNGNQNIDINSLSENVYLIPNETKILYGLDKKTKFEFIYR